ncbi:unnamed protein product [Chrysoparadoxa australica]
MPSPELTNNPLYQSILAKQSLGKNAIDPLVRIGGGYGSIILTDVRSGPDDIHITVEPDLDIPQSTFGLLCNKAKDALARASEMGGFTRTKEIMDGAGLLGTEALLGKIVTLRVSLRDHATFRNPRFWTYMIERYAAFENKYWEALEEEVEEALEMTKVEVLKLSIFHRMRALYSTMKELDVPHSVIVEFLRHCDKVLGIKVNEDELTKAPDPTCLMWLLAMACAGGPEVTSLLSTVGSREEVTMGFLELGTHSSAMGYAPMQELMRVVVLVHGGIDENTPCSGGAGPTATPCLCHIAGRSRPKVIEGGCMCGNKREKWRILGSLESTLGPEIPQMMCESCFRRMVGAVTNRTTEAQLMIATGAAVLPSDDCDTPGSAAAYYGLKSMTSPLWKGLPDRIANQTRLGY